MEVVVHYAPHVAPWLIEEGTATEPVTASGPAAPHADGVTVRHRVADPGWVVRHVLGYGPDAVVEAPEEVRAAVREAVRPLT